MMQTRTMQRATEAAPPRERAHLYASSMRRAFSEGPCGVLDAFGINRDCIGYPMTALCAEERR